MIEFYLFTIVILIAVLVVLINYHNRRQTKALEGVAESAENWLVIDVRRHRKAAGKNIHIKDPYAWIEQYSGCSDLHLLRTFKSLPALEFSCENGTLVMSTSNPDRIREKLRPALFSKPIPTAIKKSEVPLIRFNKLGHPIAKVTSFGFQDNEFLDIESKQVFEKLGLQLDFLAAEVWFYFIPKERK